MDLRKTPVLVTGGAGFIGSHLVEGLLSVGATVTVLDNLSTGRMKNLEPLMKLITFRQGDIRDLRDCAKACEGQELIFHQAALGSVSRSMSAPATSFEVNVQGTTNLFASAQQCGIRKVVYASSSSVYGSSQRLPKREGIEGRPLSPYALTKAMNEQQAAVWNRCFDMDFIGLRYFNVYGPRQNPDGPYAAVIPRFFNAVNNHLPMAIFGDGKQKRDFTFVQDVVTANILAATAPKQAWNSPYNIGSGQNISILELAATIAEVANKPCHVVHHEERPGDVRESLADISRAQKFLGFEPSYNIETGLLRMIQKTLH